MRVHRSNSERLYPEATGRVTGSETARMRETTQRSTSAHRELEDWTFIINAGKTLWQTDEMWMFFFDDKDNMHHIN